jgi:hypothetical protein
MVNTASNALGVWQPIATVIHPPPSASPLEPAVNAEAERIKVTCPNCEKPLVMKAELAGRRVKCPQCQTPFTASASGSAAPAESNPKPKPSPAAVGAVASPLAKKSVSSAQRSWKPPVQEDDDEPIAKPKKKKKRKSSSASEMFGPGMIRGLAFGMLAAVLSAVGWALVGAGTGMEIGWLAWGVGVLCGFAVAVGWQDSDMMPGVAAAGCAVFGILLGKFMLLYFVVIPHFAQLAGVPVEAFREVLAANGGYGEIFKEMFDPMDLLFIGLAIISAFKLASGMSSDD